MNLDPAVQAVLTIYEERAAHEGARIAAGEQIPLDDLLISVGPLVGNLMNSLVKGTGARSILELGTCYGGSTVWLAEGARATGGKVTTLDISATKQAYARQMLDRAGLSAFVEFVAEDALAALGRLEGPFDFVLLDLWKDLYVPCLEAFYPKLSPGALVIADNVTYPPDAYAAVKGYRDAVRAKPHIESVLLTVGNGVELSRFTRGLSAPCL